MVGAILFWMGKNGVPSYSRTTLWGCYLLTHKLWIKDIYFHIRTIIHPIDMPNLERLR